MDVLGKGSIISVDINAQRNQPVHPRIQYLAGSSTEPAIVERVRKAVGNSETVLVILDSDHKKDHVAKELQAYAPMVTAGSYLIVEDTNLNGNPVAPNFGEGPGEAVQAFLKSHKEFETDHSMERFLLTFNPGGFLKRVDSSRLPTNPHDKLPPNAAWTAGAFGFGASAKTFIDASGCRGGAPCDPSTAGRSDLVTWLRSPPTTNQID